MESSPLASSVIEAVTADTGKRCLESYDPSQGEFQFDWRGRRILNYAVKTAKFTYRGSDLLPNVELKQGDIVEVDIDFEYKHIFHCGCQPHCLNQPVEGCCLVS